MLKKCKNPKGIFDMFSSMIKSYDLFQARQSRTYAGEQVRAVSPQLRHVFGSNAFATKTFLHKMSIEKKREKSEKRAPTNFTPSTGLNNDLIILSSGIAQLVERSTLMRKYPRTIPGEGE
jgi:hypothetical protein